MPLAANLNWNIRPSSGNANNGGGFKRGASGTDWTNQNSPQYALTTATSSGAGNTILDASAANDMVGNVAQAISGTNITPGFYEIVSVVVGTSITFSTNNASQSICSGAAASAVINIGGALVSIAAPIALVATGPWKTYLQGTETRTTTITTNVSASSFLGPIIIEGYTTTPGDGTLGCATITTATNSTKLFSMNHSGWEFKNLTLSNSAGTRARAFEATSGDSVGTVFINCIFDGPSQAVYGNYNVVFSFPMVVFISCKFLNISGIAIENPGHIFGSDCFFDDTCASDAVKATSASPSAFAMVVFHRTVFAGVTGVAMNMSVANNLENSNYRFIFLIQCNLRDMAGDAIITPGASNNNLGLMGMISCILYGNGGYGVDIRSSCALYDDLFIANAFGSNTSGNVNNGTTGTIPVTLTADPNTNPASNDFTLNNTAGGGAACKGAAFPSTIPV